MARGSRADVRYFIEGGRLYCEDYRSGDTYEITCTVEEFLDGLDSDIAGGFVE